MNYLKFTAPDGIAYGPYQNHEKLMVAVNEYFASKNTTFEKWRDSPEAGSSLFSMDKMDDDFFKSLNENGQSFTRQQYFQMLENGFGETVKDWTPALALDSQGELRAKEASGLESSAIEAEPTPQSVKKDFRQRLTDQIIDQLKSGKCVWMRPWSEGEAMNLSTPRNALTGRKYNGFNALNLMSEQVDRGSEDPRWLTYNQVKKNGYTIPKDKIKDFVQVEYWQFEKEEMRVNKETGEKEKVKIKLDKPRVFYANVYHASVIEGLPEYTPAVINVWEANERAEAILTASGADISHGGDKAYYSPLRDKVQLPPKNSFSDDGAYYEVALHELGHWTGHESRQNRDLSGGFGSESYAREELRAQLASLFLSAELGIPYDTKRHAGYIGSWVNVLEKDKNEIFRASRDAEKMAEFIMKFELKRDLNNEAVKNLVANCDDFDLLKSMAEMAGNWQDAEKATGWNADGLPVDDEGAEITEFHDYFQFMKSTDAEGDLLNAIRGYVIANVKDVKLFVEKFNEGALKEQAQISADLDDTLKAFTRLDKENVKNEMGPVSVNDWMATFSQLCKTHLLIDINDTPYHDPAVVSQCIEEAREPYELINAWADYQGLTVVGAGLPVKEIGKINMGDQFRAEKVIENQVAAEKSLRKEMDESANGWGDANTAKPLSQTVDFSAARAKRESQEGAGFGPKSGSGSKNSVDFAEMKGA